jgi:hypothetical protein
MSQLPLQRRLPCVSFDKLAHQSTVFSHHQVGNTRAILEEMPSSFELLLQPLHLKLRCFAAGTLGL